MSLLIPRVEESSHWYRADGAPAYDADLRTARKEFLLPSCTNILSAWPNPGLQRWKTEQIVLSSMTLPELPGESTDARAARVIRDSEEQGKKAREFGTSIHEVAEMIAKAGRGEWAGPYPPALEQWALQVGMWFDASVEEVLWTERTLVHDGLGYAGRADLKARLKGVPGKGILDIKTQEVPFSKAKVPVKKPNFYDTWAMQLAAYQQADPDGDVDWVASLVIDSKQPSPPFLYVWAMEETVEAWRDFIACFNAWKRVKRYEPVRNGSEVVAA